MSDKHKDDHWEKANDDKDCMCQEQEENLKDCVSDSCPSGTENETANGVGCHESEKDDSEQVSVDELVAIRTAEINEQMGELKDKMVRMQAESDNYRKRMLREKEDAVRFANERLIKDLLDFLDNLDRAIASGKQSSDINGLLSGLDIAQSQLYSMLDKNWGLKVIETKGQEFDPSKHEACMQEVNEDLETETVLEEFQRGYTLHDRVIRPAKVKIGKPC